jgi:hypothetical protein
MVLFFVLDLTNTVMVRNREFVSEKFDVKEPMSVLNLSLREVIIIIISATPVRIVLMVVSNAKLCLD